VTQPTSPRSNAGFTLIEVMVALLIMMVGMIGLLQAIGITMEHNLRNQLREESVYLGERYLNEIRGMDFATLQPQTSLPTLTVPSKVRKGAVTYTVERGIAALSTDKLNLLVTVTVKWTFKTVEYQNRVTATLSQAAS